ncbi:hypothetical protein EDD22DRAFT_966986 [Suillus occidentalis]|nr:hypothetical protein EDD22DRAFT_966986 [Suillus occidentalis]
MHHTFDSEDIIYSVLKYLKRPALDILWSKRSSLVSLIMRLPQDTLEIKDDTIHLSREPTPSEWGRLRINASRVRRLIVPDSDSQEALWTYRAPKLSVSGLVLQRLFEQFPPATLFPNLCAFGSHALRESSSDLSLVRLFMSPDWKSSCLMLLHASRYMR